jgi:nucleoside-diphosphate-sugar epimerase
MASATESQFAPISVVTGASGFVATELVKQLLSLGHNVRGTVRDPSNKTKTAHLRALADALPGTLTLFAGNLTETGSFDKTVAGATYVFHVATAADFTSSNPQVEIVDATVTGARNVLAAVEKTKGTVKKVVMTSSVVAVVDLLVPLKEGSLITEADWNESADGAAGGMESYARSKVDSERVATELAAKAGIPIAFINPGWILGPVTSPVGAGFTIEVMLKTLLEGGDQVPNDATVVKVDVRDVALAHIRAAENPAAQGRYLLCDEYTSSIRDMTDLLKESFPGFKFGEGEHAPRRKAFDCSKARKDLGLELIPWQESLLASAYTEVQLKIATPQRA